ncbi:Transferase protein [Dioscorea alata]|uniref:Transferase protein n=1 Tax=Dioscorea alata TaxID=55571 RepID=A0ACB7VIE8_DIOAL|nr:Transferase protein [Dioscorea alata]
MHPKVEIIESCMVVPREETPKHRLWLSNLDVFAPRDHVPTFYLYKPNGDPDFFSVEILKNALRKVLVTFYPLAGRFVFDPDGRPEVDCNAEGVFFSVARVECTVDGFGSFRPSPALRQLLVPSVTEPERSCVLALYQLTFFKCGGVCLGCAQHHSLIDGVSALHFINAWADIARGLDNISAPPVFDHTALHARTPPTISFDHIEYTGDQLYSNLNSLDHSGQTCEATILTISKDQLKTLKYGFNGERNLSTFKAVAVHLWRTACKARELPDDQDTRFHLGADARARVKPPLPMGYIGNAIVRVSTHLCVGDLVSKTFELGIAKIAETINSLDDEYIRSVVDLLEMCKSDEKIAWGSRAINRTDLAVTSWSGLPLYEADFGWGKPCMMGLASMRFAGAACIMPSSPAGNSEGVSVLLAFDSENMMRFKEIFYHDLDSQA